VGEQDQRRGGTGAFQVGEDIAMLLPKKSGAGDDDVGFEAGRLVCGGISLRKIPDHPKAGLAMKKVLDKALERRGLYGDQDADCWTATLIRCHESNLAKAGAAFDWEFALVEGGNPPRSGGFD
jgi:hypothetical protein